MDDDRHHDKVVYRLNGSRNIDINSFDNIRTNPHTHRERNRERAGE